MTTSLPSGSLEMDNSLVIECTTCARKDLLETRGPMALFVIGSGLKFSRGDNESDPVSVSDKYGRLGTGR